MKAPVVSIVGRSDSGKTTLIEKLLPALKARGLKVGTIKHDVHGFDMDKPGKDTYRHFHAGADAVLIASPEKMALQKRLDRRPSLDELAEEYFRDVDLILTEGYKSADKPKIEVYRAELGGGLLCGPQDNLIAVVTDGDAPPGVPAFSPEEPEKIADFIIKTFLEKG